MNNKVLTLITMLLVGVLGVNAQQIKGKVVDSETKAPFEYVNVALYSEGDEDKLIKGMVTDLDGNFLFGDIKKGSYEVRVSYIGYSPVIIPVILTDKKPSANLGNISLSEDNKVLREVQITGQRSQMKFEVDKKVFNVDQNIASAGASATDALSNIPSVSVDNEGNVSLRNNSSVTIWINGRPSGLSEDNRAQILEQLPAESIQSIEIITNPSSRFSAEGSAGIINIVMKREKKTGYYGGVSANGDTFGGYGVSGNINVNYNKWEGYLNLGYRKREMRHNSKVDRTSWNGMDTTTLYQHGKGSGNGGGLLTRVGVSYYATDNDVISFTGSGMFGERNMTNRYVYNNVFPNGLNQLSNRHTKSENDHTNLEGSLDYVHTFEKDSELKLGVSYEYFDRNGHSTYIQTRDDNSDYQYQKEPRDRKAIEINADYSKTFNTYLRLETGYKGNINRSNATTRTWTDPERVIEEMSLYNVYKYDENIEALYASFSGAIIENLTYNAGLRGEYTHYTTSSIGYNTGEMEKFKKDYFDLFPSAFLSYSLPKGNELQINYSRRVNRPRGRQLNAFRNISDSANISYGNPRLNPEYTNSLELNYIKSWEEHMLSASIYYKSTDGVIRFVNHIEDNTFYTTSDNVTDSKRAGLELVGKNRLFDFLDLTTTLNMYYYKMDPFNYYYNTDQVQHYDGSKDFSWDARIIANVILPWAVSLQVTGSYNSGAKNPQGKDYESYWLDAGLRRSFLGKKISVAITARDLLDSRRHKYYSYGENFFQDGRMQWGGRNFGISVSYNFGTNGKKKNGKPNGQNGNREDGGGEGDMMDF